ncbi:MAG TPA: tripartite tricarboxylate transporter substrate binding protein [Burkholderiales bacterium]|nr:tripartite tricarboxylate transporter substrate binding protein [Burkholderiales bacterium]
MINALGFLLALSAASAMGAQPTYPERPIRLIVGQAAGGATDIVARAFAKRLGDELGQTVVVDNRAGAGGIIGTALVASAPPDGYTLLVGTNGPIAISPHITPNIQYDPFRDFAPVALFSEIPFVVVVNASVKANTLGELIALAKAQPGKLNFASSGQAGTPHLCSELFKYLAKIDIVHVPFRGGAPAQADLIAGRVQIYCAGFASLAPHVKAGKLRALAIAAAERSKTMPQTPTAAEAGLRGFEVNAWNGLLAPAKTPKPILDRLYRAVAAVMKSPEFQSELKARDVEPLLVGPAEFSAYIRRESEKWGKVIKAGRITSE